MNYVFDFGAVLFAWQPRDLVQTHFPQQASTPEQAGQLARDIFHHDDWQNFDRGTVTMDEVIERITVRLALPREMVGELVASAGDALAPLQDTLAVLAQLRTQRELGQRLGDQQSDVRLYYLSNMPNPTARMLQRKYEFLNWFDGGIFSGDVKLIKPDPAIYELLESRYALNPSRTVFFDDLKTNIEAAQQRGWHGIHFETAAQSQLQLEKLLPGHSVPPGQHR
jgi:putative hydrolase of the HAD superfamily